MMLAKVLSWITGKGLSTLLTELRQARLDRLNAENNESRIKADVKVQELEAELSLRSQKLADPILKLPLFVAELATAIYIAAILIDSTFPMAWLTPLQLPVWFQPHFGVIVVGLFGISAADRFLKGR